MKFISIYFYCICTFTCIPWPPLPLATSVLRSQNKTDVKLTDLESGRIYALHTRVVEVVAKGQNKVSSHLLSNFTHLMCSGLLHGCDVGRVGNTSPVPYGQELEGSPVFWQEEKKIVKQSQTSQSESGASSRQHNKVENWPAPLKLVGVWGGKQLILTVESPEVLEGRRKAVGDWDGTDQNGHQDECHLKRTRTQLD